MALRTSLESGMTSKVGSGVVSGSAMGKRLVRSNGSAAEFLGDRGRAFPLGREPHGLIAYRVLFGIAKLVDLPEHDLGASVAGAGPLEGGALLPGRRERVSEGVEARLFAAGLLSGHVPRRGDGGEQI